MPETDEPSGESVPCATPLSLEAKVIVFPASVPTSVVVFPVPRAAVTPLTDPVDRITMFQNPTPEPANVPHKTLAVVPPVAIGDATKTPVTVPLSTVPVNAPLASPPVSKKPLVLPLMNSPCVDEERLPLPEADVPSTKTTVLIANALSVLAWTERVPLQLALANAPTYVVAGPLSVGAVLVESLPPPLLQAASRETAAQSVMRQDA
ncbi:MAG: hypothetical protein ACHQSE_02910 [Gemmatimonadales bacterium]